MTKTITYEQSSNVNELTLQQYLESLLVAPHSMEVTLDEMIRFAASMKQKLEKEKKV